MEKQAETIATESFKKDNGRKGFKIRAIRAKDGLKIEMNSSVDFSMFRRGDNKTITIGGVKCFLPRQDSYPNIECPFISDSVWESEGYPNLSMILAENLNEGVQFNLGCFPISDDKIANYLQKMKDSVNRLYLSYLKEIDTTINIRFETIENEKHY